MSHIWNNKNKNLQSNYILIFSPFTSCICKPLLTKALYVLVYPYWNALFFIVGSVKVNFLSYRYRADKSTIFGMRGLWGLTINSGRGAMLKYL